LLDLATGRLTPLDLPFTEYGTVRAAGGKVVFRAGSSDTPTSVVTLDPDTGKTTLLRKATAVADDRAVSRYFTTPRPGKFPTSGGKFAYGLFYPPHNPDFTGPEGERPPLVVKCHGGPTAAASSTLDLRTQFWTSRGIAVLDVNYGGSTGYGREDRERLNGRGGVVDVGDCVNGGRFLAGAGGGGGAVTAGGGPGGHAARGALPSRASFGGGASHYGVSDAEALALDTHKFESRSLDGLIGPSPAMQALYRERSPIRHADRLNA